MYEPGPSRTSAFPSGAWMYVPDTIATFMRWVCVCRGTAYLAGSLKNAPNAPLVWSPHRFAILTPGAPFGSRSVHFRSPADRKTGCPDRACGVLLAFASPGGCARTGAARNSEIENATTFLGLIGCLLVGTVVGRRYHRNGWDRS